MNEEPTVLEYVKALLTPWRGAPPSIPMAESSTEPGVTAGQAGNTESVKPSIKGAEPEIISQAIARPVPQVGVWPWRALLALGLALAAQRALEPSPDRSWMFGAILYALAAAWVIWADQRGEWRLSSLPEVEQRYDPMTVRQTYLWIGAIFAALAFLTFGGNRFTYVNVCLWFVGIALIVAGFWLAESRTNPILARVRGFLIQPTWNLHLSRWLLLVFVVCAVVIFFRVYRLAQVPPEMVSDHAEKLLDIWDVLHGETHIFFPRNTGREAFQMYLTAGVIKLFGTGYSFLSMKIGTTIAGLVTLPFIYLLGKEIGNRRVGLLAMFLAGIAYWPNVITRVALRFTLYPLFVAPTLYFLIRGLRRSDRNDFILAGLSLGLGLHGYTPFRIMPFVVVVGVALYLLHRQSAGVRKRTLLYLGLLALVALIVFLPLLRFWLENPSAFNYRAFTRLGTLERPLPGPAWQIFLSNLWNAMTMFGWSNGEIWPISIPYHPALDVVSAALFYIGLVLILVRYIRQRNWLDIFLVLSVPLLLLPSILSLAFPSENPALNRTAGAMIPVFIIAALCLDGLFNGLESRLENQTARRLVWVIGLVLLGLSAAQNYDLVFNQYQRSYTLSSWNTTEIGRVIRSYADSIGSEESAYVVAYPYWVDTRLVGINAGIPTKDYALWPEKFTQTIDIPAPKLFIIKPEDSASITALQLLYPNGHLQLHPSKVENKDFYLFTVLPAQ